MISRENGRASVVCITGKSLAMLLEKPFSGLKGECQMNKHTGKGKSSKPHGLPHLRNLRQRKGLSLGQLADLTGIRRNTISHLEDGRVDPQPYHVRLLARVLEVPQFDLVS